MHYHEKLCRVAYRVVRDADKSKDIVQDVFVKLWIKRESLQIHSSLEAYLKRAVVNSSINALQEVKTASLGFNDDVDQWASPGPAEESEYIELADRADAAINNLPQRTAAVFRLIRFEGMSYREVAQALEISEKAVEKEMMKALRLLRAALKDYLVVLIYLKIFL
jgi:RNA polymerase sigma-70 factor, ECF subfamily